MAKISSLRQHIELASSVGKHRGALERKTNHLEALHRVGVAMTGSFDIDFILRELAGSAAELVGHVPIEVYYAGCDDINSRARWLPPSPGTGDLAVTSRSEFAILIASRGDNPLDRPALEEWLRQLPDGAGRHLIPISQAGELLGILIVKAALDKEDLNLLSILALQGATALHNIHLNQRRIHSERLSACGRMIGSLVHDFRSPLTAVRGYVGMLSQRALATRERKELSRLAIEECDRINTMIDELLEFSRGGGFRLAPRDIPVQAYLEELMPAIRAQFKDCHVDIETEVGYDGSLAIDPDRMKRAVLNVVTNASQSMNGSGTLFIRTERRGNHVVLEFQDTGCGIPEEIRHRIFEPFFSHGKVQGIGLGMSITRKIVEEHGGEVELVSKVGKGTRIRFVLPVKPADA